MIEAYRLDGIFLSEYERALHKGFLNASLNAIVSTQSEMSGDDITPATAAARSHDYADQMLREHRRRVTPIREDVPA